MTIKLLNECKQVWPEADWDVLDDRVIAYLPGATVTRAATHVRICWYGGISEHEDVQSARRIYELFAVDAVKAVGLALAESVVPEVWIETVVDAMDGHR